MLTLIKKKKKKKLIRAARPQLISAQHLTRARQSEDSGSSEAFAGPSISPYAEVEVLAPFVDKDKAPKKKTAAIS